METEQENKKQMLTVTSSSFSIEAISILLIIVH